ncbi:EEF1A lysine methyltransferase 1 isoform X1 [Rhodnius prolixus]|uniref:Protein-lysine N-methyltransferase n=2 Tax=Rhodnius prolixus TaxID=13249 RepID=R4G8M8_RHOPR
MSESDDDTPTLSMGTFLALQEFYAEQEKQDLQLQEILHTGKDHNNFEEDWQLSQFWYDDSTVNILTEEICNVAGGNAKIALISCPTLYKEVKKKCESCEVALFEYDNRFAVYGADFHFYDYKHPLDVPRRFANYFDLVVADPPFLSEECLTKTAITIKFLTKDKIILCTGTVMEDLIQRLLHLNKTSFKPQHKNNLANEFACYINFEGEQF